ncbi:hypothetical protein ACH9DO_04465 [Kocuria sp. M1N1S27]|uniref:hypothetical protein n=1 Tax=Kocuria kalidii TaxID=3376283 RepID=UPI0037A4FE9A
MSKRPRPSSNEPARPKRSLFRRFDDLSMRFYGPAERSRQDLRGQDQPSEQTRQWYENLQQEYVTEKDASGRTYLRPRRPEDGAPPSSDKPQ